MSGATGPIATPEPTAPRQDDTSTRPVYFDGRPVELSFERVRRPRAAFKFGPWELDAHVSREKPKDPHPNLYIVVPGEQYTAEAAPLFNHNEIISTIPVKAEPREWDVYWAIVFDPTLHEQFHSERQLILAAQDGFVLPPNLDLDGIPGATFLREFLDIGSISDLDRFRRPDGTMPRLIIVSAGLSFKATAIDPEAPPKEESGRISRAWSSITNRGRTTIPEKANGPKN